MQLGRHTFSDKRQGFVIWNFGATLVRNTFVTLFYLEENDRVVFEFGIRSNAQLFFIHHGLRDAMTDQRVIFGIDIQIIESIRLAVLVVLVELHMRLQTSQNPRILLSRNNKL